MSRDDARPGKLRVAVAETPEERERIYRFRYGIYVEEMRKRKLSYADHSTRTLRDELDEEAVLFYAETDGQIVGTIRRNLGTSPFLVEHYTHLYKLDEFGSFAPETLSFSSRLMISQTLRGSMALHLLLMAAYGHALENGALFDLCNCAPSLVGLYEHLGFRQYADNFVDPDVGYRVPMVLLLRDLGHLTTVRSPFGRKLRTYPAEFWQDHPSVTWFGQHFPMSQRVTEWLLGDQELWEIMASKLQANPQDKVGLLAGLCDEDSKRVVEKGTLLRCSQGDRVIRVNDVGSEMYLILSGLIEVRSVADDACIAVFGQGEVIGEIGLILDCDRTANVVAVEDSELLVLDRSYVDRLMANAPAVAARVLYNLCRILCERLVTTTRIRFDDDKEAAN